MHNCQTLFALIAALASPAMAADPSRPSRDVLFNCPDPAVIQPRDAESIHRGRVIQVRRMYWPKDGWPVVGEALSVAEKSGRHDNKRPAATGTWKLWTDFAAETSLVLGNDGKMTSGSRGGSWRQNGPALTLEWKNQRPQTVFLEADGRCFVGRNALGKVIFAQK